MRKCDTCDHLGICGIYSEVSCENYIAMYQNYNYRNINYCIQLVEKPSRMYLNVLVPGLGFLLKSVICQPNMWLYTFDYKGLVYGNCVSDDILPSHRIMYPNHLCFAVRSEIDYLLNKLHPAPTQLSLPGCSAEAQQHPVK